MSAAIPPQDPLGRKILDHLGAHHVMTIATTEPWAAAVFYVNDGATLYFLSSPRSRHATTFARDPRAAATIQGQPTDWRAIQGVQIEGRVRPVAPEARDAIRARYLAKFPAVAGVGGRLAEALARIEWYALEPQRVCFIDNTVTFGHRECVDLSQGRLTQSSTGPNGTPDD